MMVIPLSFQYVFVDALTALERTKTALTLSVLRKSLYIMGTIALPAFFQASTAFYAEPLSDVIMTALERTKTALTLSVLRKSLYIMGTIALPAFFQASTAFYAEPLSDVISAIVSTIVFLLIIDKHLLKREQAVIS